MSSIDDIIYLNESDYKVHDDNINNETNVEILNNDLEILKEKINELLLLISKNTYALPEHKSSYEFISENIEELCKNLYWENILSIYQDNTKDNNNSNETDKNTEVSVESQLEEQTIEKNIESDFLNNISNLLKNNEKKENQELEVIKSKEEIDYIILKTLINRFIKLHFKEKKTVLNERAKTDIEKTYGYYYWDKKKIAKHLTTKEYTKILNDKYDMEYQKGKSENIPLAFYFDLSGSMRSYTLTLAQISYHLLKNKIKVLIGFNEEIYYQIDKIDDYITFNELNDFYNNYTREHKGIKTERVNKNIDEYLIEKLCEKCVIFSDLDSYENVCSLSRKADVYLMYFNTYNDKLDENFKGCAFIINNSEELFNSMRIISKTNYQVLKQRSLKLKKGGL